MHSVKRLWSWLFEKFNPRKRWDGSSPGENFHAQKSLLCPMHCIRRLWSRLFEKFYLCKRRHARTVARGFQFSEVTSWLNVLCKTSMKMTFWEILPEQTKTRAHSSLKLPRACGSDRNSQTSALWSLCIAHSEASWVLRICCSSLWSPGARMNLAEFSKISCIGILDVKLFDV